MGKCMVNVWMSCMGKYNYGDWCLVNVWMSMYGMHVLVSVFIYIV